VLSQIQQMRLDYHTNLLVNELIHIAALGHLNIADSGNRNSCAIACDMTNLMAQNTGIAISHTGPTGDSQVGTMFQQETLTFLQCAVGLLQQNLLRTGNFDWAVQRHIDQFEQYQHINQYSIGGQNAFLLADVGVYNVKPDIVFFRTPITLSHIGATGAEPVAQYTPLLDRSPNNDGPHILMASISCKLTIRSDRSQNTRTEAIGLIRQRKGSMPKMVCVTAEPLPTRLASIAAGTGEIDCVYHAALSELLAAVPTHISRRSKSIINPQRTMLDILVNGRRLRDISDLPFDLIL